MASTVGRTHGRPDLDRCGLFWEMSYMNGPYVAPLRFVSVRKGAKSFPVSFPKWKGGLQDCYFDKDPLKRVFIGEAFYDVLREQLKAQIENNSKNRSKNPFLCLFPLQASSTPGDHFGTFQDKNFEAFSPVKRPGPPKEEIKRGIYTSFPHKGGYGYIGQTFEKYPVYKPDFYDAAPALFSKSMKEHKEKFRTGLYRLPGISEPYFEPNPYLVEKPVSPYRPDKSKKTKIKAVWVWGGPTKKLSADKGGCFDKYPTHSADKYFNEAQVDKELDKKLLKRSAKKGRRHDSGRFNIPSESKKWLIKSTTEYNVKFKVNAKNWKCARPFVVN